MPKKDVLVEIFDICAKKGDMSFDNELVKKICQKHDFGNPFDVTKIDNADKLPDSLTANDYGIVHLGNGRHKFVKGVGLIYHEFEEIQNHVEWKYKKSLLNRANSSESNMLSVANNQRILHHFLFGKDKELDDIDIAKRPKTYFPHRTKTSFNYSVGDEKLDIVNVQIEIDLTIEYEGHIGVFEAKNGVADTFSVYQIYHPFLYYHNMNHDEELAGKIKKISSVFVSREIDSDTIKLWAYTFPDPDNCASIKLSKSAAYTLVR